MVGMEMNSHLISQSLNNEEVLEQSNEVARNIRYMRELRGWTQAELARRAGVSRTTVRRLEEGQPFWRPTLERVAGAFKITVTEIYRTTRFRSVLGEELGLVKHTRSRDYWHVRSDKRTSVPADNELLIQNLRERQRLGKLGFVPVFITGLDFHLPQGPGICRLEVYGKVENVAMPQFSVNSFFVLTGLVVVSFQGSTEMLGPGDVIAVEGEEPVGIEPYQAYSDGPPCEVLVIGSVRKKVV